MATPVYTEEEKAEARKFLAEFALWVFEKIGGPKVEGNPENVTKMRRYVQDFAVGQDVKTWQLTSQVPDALRALHAEAVRTLALTEERSGKPIAEMKPSLLHPATQLTPAGEPMQRVAERWWGQTLLADFGFPVQGYSFSFHGPRSGSPRREKPSDYLLDSASYVTRPQANWYYHDVRKRVAFDALMHLCDDAQLSDGDLLEIFSEVLTRRSSAPNQPIRPIWELRCQACCAPFHTPAQMSRHVCPAGAKGQG